MGAPSSRQLTSLIQEVKHHVLNRVDSTVLGTLPYYHLFMKDIFPAGFYESLRTLAHEIEHSAQLQPRFQDNPAYTNSRFNLVGHPSETIRVIEEVFSDTEIKIALLSPFYLSATESLADCLRVHDEFELTFTQPDRFQRIHVDIPPKYISMVFYLPNKGLTHDEKISNATVLYDKALHPTFVAEYSANSLFAFAPHFYSYHGFSTTIARPAMVLFYVNRLELKTWNENVRAGRDKPPFGFIKDSIARKLEQHPLREYGDDVRRIIDERERCRINAPLGRVLREEDRRSLLNRVVGRIRYELTRRFHHPPAQRMS